MPNDRVTDRIALEFAEESFELRDARKSEDTDERLTHFIWTDRPLSASHGQRVLIRLVENVDVSFASDTYTVAENGSVEVNVTLSADIGQNVTVPITVVNQDGATDDDYNAPADVTFVAGETSKSFVITPVDDGVDDDDETLKVQFGTLPESLSPGTTTETLVTIVDNDDPEVEVNFRRAIHDVAEGASQTVTVKLTADPERTVVVPLTATDQNGATSGDYAALPASVTFDPGDTSKTFTFTATDDAVDDDGESVLLEFGDPARRGDAGDSPQQHRVNRRRRRARVGGRELGADRLHRRRGRLRDRYGGTGTTTRRRPWSCPSPGRTREAPAAGTTPAFPPPSPSRAGTPRRASPSPPPTTPWTTTARASSWRSDPPCPRA